jgi:hypothetical protein
MPTVTTLRIHGRVSDGVGKDFMLKGRCALITGSTQGLGYAMAERLADITGAAIPIHGGWSAS